MIGWLKSALSPKKNDNLKPQGGAAATEAFVSEFQECLDRGNRLLGEGKAEEAAGAYRRAAELKPDDALPHVNLAYALIEIGASEEATAALDRALHLDPANPDACYMQGKVLRHRGQLDEAIAYLSKSIALGVKYEYVFLELCEVYLQRQDAAGAIGVILDGIRRYPAIAEFHVALGDAYRAQGDEQKAISSYRMALILNPRLYDGHHKLGLVYLEQKNWAAAGEHFRQAIAADAQQGYAYCNLGIALEKQGELVGAIEQYRTALSLYPDAYPVLNNLAVAYRVMGRLGESIPLHRRMIEQHPEDADARSTLLFELSYYPESSPQDYLKEATAYGHVVGACARPFQWPDGQAGAARARLRVGMVSGDLNNHPVGYFLENVIRHLAGTRLELIAYPTIAEEDHLTARIKPLFAEWHSLAGLSDEAAANRIHGDRVDVLLDLSGHTKHNRLPVFAWKPAPLQVSWLGYFASTGVAEIDYVLADRIAVPDDLRCQFTESVWYLPDTRLCFSPPDISVDVAPLPAERLGYVTFGFFQGLTKLNDQVLAVWGRILRLLPTARLRLQAMYLGFDKMDQYLLDRLARAGIPVERVAIHGSTHRESYLEAHGEVDIILDTFPYPGGTTTCEALWMGVPTLTLSGDSMLSRQGVSLLTCAGLGDWVAPDVDGYVAQAVDRAGDIEGLAKLRRELRSKVASSPIFDAARFAANFEDALFGMWRQKMGG